VSLLKYYESPATNMIIVSFGYGDLLLEGICTVAEEADIHTGVVMSGIGSLTHGHIHAVATQDMPPRDEFLHLPGPLEIVGFAGVIADHEPHLHISLMDAKGRFYGGHMEEGCKVLTLAEMSILRVPDLRLTRRIRDNSRFPLLDAD